MPLRRLMAFAWPHRMALIAMIVLAVAGSGVMLAVPWLAGQMIGGMVAGQAPVGRLAGLLLGAMAVLALLNMVTMALSSATNARLLADLREQIYAHLQTLPLAFHHDRRHGDTLALATFEVARLGHFVAVTMVSFPARLLTAAGAAVLMFRIDPRLSLLVPALVPLFYFILKVVGRRLRGIAAAAQQAEAGVVATIEQNLAMLPAIKSFARETEAAADYSRAVRASMDLHISEGRIQAVLEPLIGLIAGSAAVLLLIVAGRQLDAGTMSAASLFSFLLYAALLTRPVAALAHLYGEVQSARGTLARLERVLGEPVEPGYQGAVGVERARGAIAFRAVGFAYPGRAAVLDGASLAIAPGEIVALVGDNGAGKTTLINLLLRFAEPAHGTILLDGQDIATLDVQALRRQIGVVPQRAALFNGTIRANLAFGLPGASDEQLWHAARLAQAEAFIAALPDGLDSAIGDHGVRLSGGQRQRLSLARALVKDPPILILDEATAMFDLEGERAFLEACREGLAGRTVLLTTHRPASLVIADRVVVVEGGRLREVPRTAGQASTARR